MIFESINSRRYPRPPSFTMCNSSITIQLRSNITSSSMSLFIRLFAFSIVHIAMSTELKPPFGEELPINPSIFTKLSDRSHCKCFSFSLAKETNGNIIIAFRFEVNMFLSINNSATNVLPADVGAEKSRFLFPSNFINRI